MISETLTVRENLLFSANVRLSVGYHSPQFWFPKWIPKSLPQLWTEKRIRSLLVTKWGFLIRDFFICGFFCLRYNILQTITRVTVSHIECAKKIELILCYSTYHSFANRWRLSMKSQGKTISQSRRYRSLFLDLVNFRSRSLFGRQNIKTAKKSADCCFHVRVEC